MKLAASGIELEGPLLRVAPPGHPGIVVDARGLDEVSAGRARGRLARLWAALSGRRGAIVLRVGTLRVTLSIAEGTAAAARVADAMAPWTRGAPIHDPAVYLEAKRRLGALLAGEPPPPLSESLRPVRVGASDVRVDGEQVVIGDTRLDIAAVRAAAHQGRNLPLAGGVPVQAALVLLVVAAETRAAEPEDVEALRDRVAAYERWTGRGAGR